jgi:hypothetical protein
VAGATVAEHTVVSEVLAPRMILINAISKLIAKADAGKLENVLERLKRGMWGVDTSIPMDAPRVFALLAGCRQ